jgi:tetratricopeptide (TPR) repeat protein
MAQLYLSINMVKEAQAALDQAIAESPSDPEAYLFKAGFALRSQNLAEAESLYQKANGLLAGFNKSVKRKEALQAGIQNGIASVAELRKDWPGAQKALEAWLKLDPKNVIAMQRIAYSLFQQKNVDGALAKLREARKIKPDLMTPEVMLAQFCEASGDRKNAEQWMAKAVAAAPKDLQTRMAVGQWAMEAGNLDEAQKHAIAATQLAPKSMEAKLFRGVTALFQKDYSAAESIFEGAVKQTPQNVVATNNLALALIAQQDEAKGKRALELAEANAKQMPKSPEIASTYGLVLYKLGRIDDAEKALRVAAPLATSDVDTAYIVARVAVDRGRKDEARKTLEAALKMTKPFMFRQEAEELLQELKK